MVTVLEAPGASGRFSRCLVTVGAPGPLTRGCRVPASAMRRVVGLRARTTAAARPEAAVTVRWRLTRVPGPCPLRAVLVGRLPRPVQTTTASVVVDPPSRGRPDVA